MIDWGIIITHVYRDYNDKPGNKVYPPVNKHSNGKSPS